MITSFNKQWSSKTEGLEVHAIAGVESGRHRAAPVEKEGRGPGEDSVV